MRTNRPIRRPPRPAVWYNIANHSETNTAPEKCGEWRLLREIGRGAYGVVYLAEASDGRLAALKLCRRAGTEDERYARELRGAKLYMSVSASEGLVGMREVIEDDWGPFLA